LKSGRRKVESGNPESGKRPIRALILDFDGLIINTESALIDSYAAVYRAHGVPFDQDEFIRNVGGAEYDFDPWHPFGRTADRAELETARSRHNREIGQILPLMPGVRALLDAARSAGLRAGVASNSGHAHVEGHLARLGILDRIEFIGCREDVARLKPDPDLYILALDRLGLRGSEAVAFEDSHAGSRAAKRAGLWVVAVPNNVTSHHDFGHVDWKVGSLSEVTVPELLRRFGQR
jgi:HAD superfamily hydrolase (TIGR01509 family)